jgi:hypothetical protein
MNCFLIPETAAVQDGISTEIQLQQDRGKPLLLTLGITRVVENGSVDISLWGSADRRIWRKLLTYPQKFYCGVYPLLLDLSRHPEVSFLRAQWSMSCWGLCVQPPAASFYLSAENLTPQSSRCELKVSA